MANQDHLLVLKKGVVAWNAWRAANPRIKPDLAAARLAGRKLEEIDLRGADLKSSILTGCDLSGANLSNAQLGEATLRDCILAGAILFSATLRRSDCRGAFLRWADLSRADFTGARLSNADLRRTHLARTVFKDADLSGCCVYGSAVWNVKLDGAVQTDLVITEHDEPEITVDDLEVAQFVYLILNNRKIRNIIDSMTSKAVLLLGRFTPKRKSCLDGLRTELRRRGYLPILFDFEGPASRNLTDTVSTLAHLSRFIIADITDAKSVPQELARIVPHLPRVPVQPVLMTNAREYSMFRDFNDYPWVLPLHKYKDAADLAKSAGEKVIAPAEAKSQSILQSGPTVSLRWPGRAGRRETRT